MHNSQQRAELISNPLTWGFDVELRRIELLTSSVPPPQSVFNAVRYGQTYS